jgi:hypothetical protein
MRGTPTQPATRYLLMLGMHMGAWPAYWGRAVVEIAALCKLQGNTDGGSSPWEHTAARSSQLLFTAYDHYHYIRSNRHLLVPLTYVAT